MPRRSTGDTRYATAFLRQFGKVVTLPDNSEIKGILDTADEDENVGSTFPGTNERYFSYRLWIPSVFRGTFDRQTRVTIEGDEYFVVDFRVDYDDWIEAVLRKRGPEQIFTI